MATITKKCSECNTTREFKLIIEDPIASTYECRVCGLKSRHRTALGWGLASIGPLVALGGFLGIEALDHHHDDDHHDNHHDKQ